MVADQGELVAQFEQEHGIDPKAVWSEADFDLWFAWVAKRKGNVDGSQEKDGQETH